MPIRGLRDQELRVKLGAVVYASARPLVRETKRFTVADKMGKENSTGRQSLSTSKGDPNAASAPIFPSRPSFGQQADYPMQ